MTRYALIPDNFSMVGSEMRDHPTEFFPFDVEAFKASDGVDLNEQSDEWLRLNYFYKVETEELPEPSDNIIYRSDYMTSDDGVTYKLKWVFYKPEGILTMTEAETLKATEYNEGKE